ncbi:MAG: hypothetical protein F4103_06650 [Boseongicola sp. SB0673_bin_14]|nr:hypothetical protein [Boseongicola sp. SB0673_bin_14]
MLSVEQTRIIQWERDVSDLDDTSMVLLANSMFGIESVWSRLEVEAVGSIAVTHEGQELLIVYRCVNAEDILQLLILAVQ